MPNKYLDSVGLAEYTGLIKRDLAPKASPAFTGTPTAPTPTAGDDSTKIATTEFVNDAIDTEITSEIAAEVTRADGKYLPLSGGTMTGIITLHNVSAVARRDVTNSWTVLMGGSADNNGAYLSLYGKDYSSDNNAGRFILKAQNSNGTKYLVGYGDGLLTWDGSSIALSRDVLSLSGGTLTGDIILKNSIVAEVATSAEKGVNPSTTSYPMWFAYYDKNGVSSSNRVCGIGGVINTNGSVQMGLHAQKWVAESTDLASVYVTNPLSGDKNFKPGSDNDYTLGTSSLRWKQLYARTATINTSDERLKDNIVPIPDEVLDAWAEVNWYQYQFKDSIKEKGETKARFHTGAIAQRIESVFTAHGLDANRYGLLCYDEWEAEAEGKDDEGNVVTPAREAGNRYSLRYEEALCMEAAYQRRRADNLEERIARLEALMANTETETE